MPVWAAMFLEQADGASVPVVAHLDHGTSEGECRQAIELGFTSVLFDGSRLPSEENIAAMVVSAGNVHLQTSARADIDMDRLRAIEGRCRIPLMIHGGSGVPRDVRARLARTNHICKFNIGTEQRMVFGAALRNAMAAAPETFDRIALLRKVEAPLTEAARRIIRDLHKPR